MILLNYQKRASNLVNDEEINFNYSAIPTNNINNNKSQNKKNFKFQQFHGKLILMKLK